MAEVKYSCRSFNCTLITETGSITQSGSKTQPWSVMLAFPAGQDSSARLCLPPDVSCMPCLPKNDADLPTQAFPLSKEWHQPQWPILKAWSRGQLGKLINQILLSVLKNPPPHNNSLKKANQCWRPETVVSWREGSSRLTQRKQTIKTDEVRRAATLVMLFLRARVLQNACRAFQLLSLHTYTHSSLASETDKAQE